MIKFKTLSDCSNAEILDCFNRAFSDYFIPFNLNIEQLESKFLIENVDKDFSIGAFKDDKLIGFVLHGNRVINSSKMAYNAGTGVIPQERGRGLTFKMYQFAIPLLKSSGFDKVVLEVISKNVPAIKSYQKTGFTSSRNLDCFKGQIKSKEINARIKIHEPDKLNLEFIQQFGDVVPSWQNTKQSIQNMDSSARQILAYKENTLVGYCFVNKSNNRILQIAVKEDSRNKHIGKSMLNYIGNNYSKETSIINVDSKAEIACKFFENNNLKKSISQIEMRLNLKDK